MPNWSRTTLHFVAVSLALILLGMLYCARFSSRSFWSENEAFYALGARSVLQGDVLLPKIYHNEYADKPPLFFWWVSAVSALFGGVREWTVRLANVLPSLTILAALYVFASRWFNRSTALLAVLITGTAYEFWQQATQVLTDMTLTALLMFAWGAMFSILMKGFSWRRWLVMWGCVALGVLTKGPEGLALTALLAIAFCMARFGWRDGWIRLMRLRPLSGVAVSIGLFALWCAAVYAFIGGEPLRTIIIQHNVTRFLHAFDHEKPLWYYFHQLPVNMLPWSILLPWTGWRLIKEWRYREKKEQETLVFALTITAVVFGFFSLSSSKRDYYLLPLIPWLGLIIADFLWQVLCAERSAIARLKELGTNYLENRKIRWNATRLLVAGTMLVFIAYALYSWVGSRFLEPRKSPKPLVEAIQQATDENDHLVIVNEKDPRILYYLHEPFSTCNASSEDLQKQRYLMLSGHELDLVVDDDDLKNVVKALAVPLYLELASNFHHKKFYILTNEPKIGQKPIRV